VLEVAAREENLNKKNTEVQEFRSSGVQENPETEDLPGDRSDLTGLFLGYNPHLTSILNS